MFFRVLRQVWFQSILFGALVAAHVALEFFPRLRAHESLPKVVSFVSVFVVAWGVGRFLNVLKESSALTGKLSPDIRNILFTLIRISLYALALLVALDTIGISVTPLIASLGVGSIAVGLALQDTLGNLISGAYLYLDRPVAVGDWIRLDTGLEGQVVRIGWRTTRLVASDNMVVIPNAKLSSAILTNLSLPNSDVPVTVSVGVGYESDLDQVEKVLSEVGREFLGKHPGAVKETVPIIRYQGFGDSSIQANLTVRVRAYGDQFLARHELIKAIKLRLDREKIEIPFPQRVVRTLGV